MIGRKIGTERYASIGSQSFRNRLTQSTGRAPNREVIVIPIAGFRHSYDHPMKANAQDLQIANPFSVILAEVYPYPCAASFRRDQQAPALQKYFRRWQVPPDNRRCIGHRCAHADHQERVRQAFPDMQPTARPFWDGQRGSRSFPVKTASDFRRDQAF